MRSTAIPQACLGALSLLVAFATACAAPPQRAQDTTSAKIVAPVDDRVRLARLEREALALVRTDGCSSAAGCRTAPVGWRGCGGPRSYIVYCAATTDSAALARKLEELRQAEMDYNQKSGMMSTCEMRMPPTVTTQGGRCSESR